LSLSKNADISIFLKEEGKDISSQISVEFAYRKATPLERSEDYIVNGNINTSFVCF